MGQKIMLLNVRLSFPVLGEPEQYQGKGAFRWSATALVPVGSPYKKQIDDIYIELAKEAWEKRWETIYKNCLPDPKACAWMDGARKDYDGYAGHWALSAHRYPERGARPLVMDRDKSPIYKPDNTLYEGKGGIIYAGCYVNMQVELYCQKGENKGLRAGLLGVQKVRDGDAFGGGAAPAVDDFAEVADGAGADDLT